MSSKNVRLTVGWMACCVMAATSNAAFASDSDSLDANESLLKSTAMGNFEPEPTVQQEWEFRVLLGDREIGTHEFRVSRQGDIEQVEIDARFDVKFLFFNAYSYSHQNLERWDGDCLEAIESVTDDNGTSFELRGMARDGRFIFDSNPQGPSTGPACTRSFAYWNPDFLESEKLLNAQTGEIVDVEITRKADEILTIDNQPVAAERYSLAMEDGIISLWYGKESGQWLALEAPARGDRILRYEPVRLPVDPTADEQLAFE
ncbi:MAG TPA: DUF6134 family protein [Xanthomonadales bacterium]|nr:DUF6134 family protein [Xanthomonadales bacterium]